MVLDIGTPKNDEEEQMALRSPVRHEIGERLAWLRKNAQMTGRDLAVALGTTDKGISTKLESGKSLTLERVIEVAELMAGEGQLVNDPRALFDFMLWGGEVATVLRPHLRLAGQGEPPTGIDQTRRFVGNGQFDPSVKAA